eukprot:scaffold15958_cov72-Skeletonema_dohrnii-CCMP3373.AAC.1
MLSQGRGPRFLCHATDTEESGPHKLATYQAIECHLTILHRLNTSLHHAISFVSRCRFAAAAAPPGVIMCVIDDRHILLKRYSARS